MPVRLTSIVFGATDVAALADFWRRQTGDWYVRHSAGAEVRVAPSLEDGSVLDLLFAPAPSRQHTGKNRIHLDLSTNSGADWESALAMVEHYGATPVDIGQGELVPWAVLADPEGNEFCLLKPHDRYPVAGALAAVVVDCADPPAMIEFWGPATGWTVQETEPDFATLRPPGTGDIPRRSPFLEFSKVADRSPEQGTILLGFESFWAHQHEDDIARLVSLGARRVREHDGSPSYTLLADPEGNEFRVVIPVWPPPPVPHPARR